MPLDSFSIRWSGDVSAADGPISVGDVLIPNTAGTSLILATSANRGTRRSECIALSALGAGKSGPVQPQYVGMIPASVSGLAPGSASWVRCSTTGRIERCSPSGSDDIIGYAEADGRVHFLPGLFTAAIIAGGGGGLPGGNTGEVQYNNAGSFGGATGVKAGSGFISIGTTPATFGGIRLSYGDTYGVYARNSSNNDDPNLISLMNGTGPYGLGTDLIRVGAGGYNQLILAGTGRTLYVWSDTVRFYSGNGGTERLHLDGSSSDFLALGSSPAAAGDIRLANTAIINCRNVANSGNVQVVTVNASDQVVIGSASNPGAVRILAPSGQYVAALAPTHYLQTEAAADIAVFSAALITIKPTSMQATGNARRKGYSDIANVQTTDATVTSLFTWTILDEAVTRMVAEVDGDKSDGSQTASYVRALRFKRDGGTVTAGTIQDLGTDEEDAAWDCTVDNSTSTGRVRVTGKAATTIDWGGTMTRWETAHA